MKPDRTLAVQVAAAVGAMLVGRSEITLAQVEADLPAHLRAGRPSLKSIAKAIVAAGWEGVRQSGGHVTYRLPVDRVGEGDPEPGDNGGNERLCQHYEAIERLIEERTSINNDIKDRFAVAQSEGFDVPSMRAVIRRRRMDRQKRIEADALLDIHAVAGGVADAA